jgi:tRNA pseudouridine32 synthase/23S rRNA pseudouridine746 synthase/23S rRNA pseudouridine1911/1915/1917 synthase
VEIIHEDRDILVVDKAPGLLTIATDRDRERTAYHILTDYVRKGRAKSRNRIFIVHRLDRETSGILVFAKNEETKHHLQSHWPETEKRYLAVVHGRLPQKSGTISSYLAESGTFRVYSTPDAKAGRLSHTAYEVLKETDTLSLLGVRLLTGRKHQIRVHLADCGHPVVGDTKYGKKDDHHRRLALHSKSITIRHPFTGRQVNFQTGEPAYLIGLMRG